MPASPKTTDKPAPRSTARKSGSKAKSQTKAGAILSQLRRPSGATVAHLRKVTGWQAHSIRATLTGLRKQGHGIVRGTNAKGVTTYRVAKGT